MNMRSWLDKYKSWILFIIVNIIVLVTMYYVMLRIGETLTKQGCCKVVYMSDMNGLVIVAGAIVLLSVIVTKYKHQ